MELNAKIKLKYNKALYKVLEFYNLNVHEHTEEHYNFLHLNVSDILPNFTKIALYGDSPEENNRRIESELQKEYPYLVPFRRISTAFTFDSTVITKDEFVQINGILITLKQLKKINSKNT